MPDAALPEPWGTRPTRPRLERDYQDLLGRPMRGSVVIAGGQRAEHGGTVVASAPVTVELVDGRLSVELPPGTYELTATLTTIDGARAKDVQIVTI